MNKTIAVIGKDHFNSVLCRELEKEGFILSFPGEPDDISSVTGQCGSFKINTNKKHNGAESVVTDFILFAGGGETPFVGAIDPVAILPQDSVSFEKLPFSKTPVLFLLDHPDDSSAGDTRAVLERAIWLTKRRRKAICLARYIRTAGDGLEELYRDARSAGIVFAKYDSLEIITKENKEYDVIVREGEEKTVFHGILSMPGEQSTDMEKKLEKLLKIKAERANLGGGGRFFVNPVHTSRKGIYYINKNIFSESESEFRELARLLIESIKQDTREGLNGGKQNRYAEVDAEKCAFCYTCYRACPHFAMAPDNEKPAMVNVKEVCYGCGICCSICPAKAISMKNCDDDVKNNDGAEKAISKNDESGKEVFLTIFCCENSGEYAVQEALPHFTHAGREINITPVQCSGELEVQNLLAALQRSEYVLAAFCMDSACRHFEGSRRARKNVSSAHETMKSLGIPEERLGFVQLSHAMPNVLIDVLKEIMGSE